MKCDNVVKKDWFVLTNGQWFSSQPKDKTEAELFRSVIDEALRCHLKVMEVWVNKTELEFKNRFNSKSL